MERDEVYVPKTREDLGIPEKPNHEIDWDEIFGDTPVYTLYMLIRQQVLAFPAYLRTSLDTSVKSYGRELILEYSSLQRLRPENLPQMDQPLRSQLDPLHQGSA